MLVVQLIYMIIWIQILFNIWSHSARRITNEIVSMRLILVNIRWKKLVLLRTVKSLQEAPFPHCVWQFEDWLHHPGFLFANDGGNFQLCPPWLITLQNCTPLQARGLQIVLQGQRTNCNNSTAARWLDKLWVMGHSWPRKKSAMGDSKNCLGNRAIQCN